jgi:hypothetical protein
MSRISKADKLKDVHAQALRSFSLSQSATEDQRSVSLNDRRFHTVSGAQWDGPIGAQFENRIRLEADMVHKAVKRAETEYRENRITVDYISKDGDEHDELADLCDGLFRADCQDSQAEEAFDNAFVEGLGGGMGAWRLTTEYEDDEDDEDDRQRVRLEPIYEADQRVFFDANAKRYDKSDAGFAFVVTSMTPEAFKEQYNEDPASWPADVVGMWGSGFHWSRPDAVFVAEYYVVDNAKKTILRYETATGDKESRNEADLTEEVETDLADRGFVLVSEKVVKVRQVHKYIMSGGGVLEDCGVIAGTEIPIVPFYGERAFIEGAEHWRGIVRGAKDMQRLTNMQLSLLASISASGGTDKPIFTPEQIQGHDLMWARDAVENYAYLLVNPVTDAAGNPTPVGPVGMKSAPQVPQSLATLLQVSNQYTSDILGNQENGDEYSANLSGKAVELVQNRLDRQVYLYMSNFAKAMKHCGKIWLSMARDVYVESGRKMKVIDDQEQVEWDTLNVTAIDDKAGLVTRNDMSKAKFEISVDVGATSSSARSATVRTLGSMLPMVTDPADQKVLLATIGRNLEGEGMGGMREYFRRALVQMGVEEPTDADKEEAAKQQAPQPGAQELYLMAEAEKSRANAIKAEADTGKAVADTELTQAKTAETLAGINVTQRNAALEAALKLRQAASAPPQIGVSNEVGQ